MARECRNLGAAVSALRRVSEVSDVDWMIGGWGECRDLIARGINRERDEVARDYGFANVAELANEVAERTSKRWVWFNFPGV
jgi:hypothetical protein